MRIVSCLCVILVLCFSFVSANYYSIYSPNTISPKYNYSLYEIDEDTGNVTVLYSFNETVMFPTVQYAASLKQQMIFIYTPTYGSPLLHYFSIAQKDIVKTINISTQIYYPCAICVSEKTNTIYLFDTDGEITTVDSDGNLKEILASGYGGPPGNCVVDEEHDFLIFGYHFCQPCDFNLAIMNLKTHQVHDNLYDTTDALWFLIDKKNTLYRSDNGIVYNVTVAKDENSVSFTQVAKTGFVFGVYNKRKNVIIGLAESTSTNDLYVLHLDNMNISTFVLSDPNLALYPTAWL